MTARHEYPPEYEAQLLHIIAQDCHHNPAIFYGHPAALAKLGRALLASAESGKGQNVTGFMATDGEGYTIEIHPLDGAQMDQAPMPYAQLGLPWKLEKP
jgi:hypothetical protein